MALEKDLLPIGKVVKPHGIRGMIKVKYFGEDVRQFLHYREIFLEDSGGGLKPYEVLEVIPQPSRLILRLNTIERIEDVLPLIGKKILVEKTALPSLKEGEYYWIDILGMTVETGEGKKVGKVKDLFSTGANDIYVVEGKRGEIFLPATEEVIQSVDLGKGVIKVIRMEGLWEEEDEV